eukprot:s47_g26.t1
MVSALSTKPGQVSLNDQVDVFKDSTNETKEDMSKRQQKQRLDRIKLQRFLIDYNFRGINVPMSGKKLSFQRTGDAGVYPVHMAAQLGDLELLRLVLRAGADPEMRTSEGCDALDFAHQAKISVASHRQELQKLTALELEDDGFGVGTQEA